MSIIVEQVDQIEVFVNEAGSISIRQESWIEPAAIVVIPVQFIDAVVDALRDAKEEAIG